MGRGSRVYFVDLAALRAGFQIASGVVTTRKIPARNRWRKDFLRVTSSKGVMLSGLHPAPRQAFAPAVIL